MQITGTGATWKDVCREGHGLYTVYVALTGHKASSCMFEEDGGALGITISDDDTREEFSITGHDLTELAANVEDARRMLLAATARWRGEDYAHETSR